MIPAQPLSLIKAAA